MSRQVLFDQMNRLDESDEDDDTPISEVIRVIRLHRAKVLDCFDRLPASARNATLSSVFRLAMRRVSN